MKKMNKWLKRCKAAGRAFSATIVIFLMNSRTAYASSISQSRLALGTERLIKDATSWLMILAPILAGLLIIYFCIRRSKWIRRNGTTVLWLLSYPASGQCSEAQL